MKHSPNMLRVTQRSAAVLIALGSLAWMDHDTKQGTSVQARAAEAVVAPPPTVAETTTLPPTTTTIGRVVLQRASRRGVVRPRLAPAPTNYPVGCELYWPEIAKYPWPQEGAKLTMMKESGCDPNKVSRTNDYGLFQLHNLDVRDPAQNVAIGYQKYHGGRVGEDNFSAWFAVCTKGNNPQPKYEGINCQ